MKTSPNQCKRLCKHVNRLIIASCGKYCIYFSFYIVFLNKIKRSVCVLLIYLFICLLACLFVCSINAFIFLLCGFLTDSVCHIYSKPFRKEITFWSECWLKAMDLFSLRLLILFQVWFLTDYWCIWSFMNMSLVMFLICYTFFLIFRQTNTLKESNIWIKHTVSTL